VSSLCRKEKLDAGRVIPLYFGHQTSSLITVPTELTQLPDMQLTSKRNLKAIDVSFLPGNLHKQASQ
jgi:hypothetical protein